MKMIGPCGRLAPLAPGAALEEGKMYARLFHGREAPDAEMNGWGFDGPTFGPLVSANLTYLQHLRIYNAGREEAETVSRDGLLAWEGRYYGDLCIFVAQEGETA